MKEQNPTKGVKKDWTKKEEQRMLNLRRAGVSVFLIAGALLRTEHSINTKLRDLEEPSPDENKRLYMLDLLQKGCNPKQIASIMGILIDSVYKAKSRLKKQGYCVPGKKSVKKRYIANFKRCRTFAEVSKRMKVTLNVVRRWYSLLLKEGHKLNQLH